jgi:hypothetical protein
VEDTTLLTIAMLAATVAIALATGVLAWFTAQLARWTAQMAKATRQANVLVTVEPCRWSYIHTDIVTENVGNAPAFDIIVSFDPPVIAVREDRTEEVPANQITALRPGATIRNWIGRGATFVEQNHTVTVSWTERPNSKQRIETSYRVSLSHFSKVHQLGSGDPAVAMADELRKIREELPRMFGRGRRLQVDVFGADERAREREQIAERRNTPPLELKPDSSPKPASKRKPAAKRTSRKTARAKDGPGRPK